MCCYGNRNFDLQRFKPELPEWRAPPQPVPFKLFLALAERQIKCGVWSSDCVHLVQRLGAFRVSWCDDSGERATVQAQLEVSAIETNYLHIDRQIKASFADLLIHSSLLSLPTRWLPRNVFVAIIGLSLIPSLILTSLSTDRFLHMRAVSVWSW